MKNISRPRRVSLGMIKFIKNKWFIGIVIGLLVIVIIFIIVTIFQLYTPLDKSGGEQVFIIEEGEGMEKIADNLKAEKLIRNKWVYYYYLWFKGKTGKLQAGTYSLSPLMNIPEIANKIIRGDVIENWVKVTIPEGWRNKQIEERLIDFGLINQGEKLPENLEGYLFPDTYYFYKDSSSEDMIQKMQDNFDKKITEDLKKEIEKQKKELDDIIIMASLIEKEVRTYEDMQIVSGVFWKRIGNNYPLESCATIAYVLGIDKWRYTIEDTKIESPYNTYRNVGLPPTPINNPGLNAIKAAINPVFTDYNFFLSAPDGTTIFSKTLEEHNINKRKYLD